MASCYCGLSSNRGLRVPAANSSSRDSAVRRGAVRIVQIEIRNFRGIRKLDWNPSPGMNCLIGPGDSTKTTILDAIAFWWGKEKRSADWCAGWMCVGRRVAANLSLYGALWQSMAAAYLMQSP